MFNDGGITLIFVTKPKVHLLCANNLIFATCVVRHTLVNLDQYLTISGYNLYLIVHYRTQYFAQLLFECCCVFILRQTLARVISSSDATPRPPPASLSRPVRRLKPSFLHAAQKRKPPCKQIRRRCHPITTRSDLHLVKLYRLSVDALRPMEMGRSLFTKILRLFR